ncbi:MAG: hypothetical protein ACRDSK_27240 [Actinophytocola sp.]|uniref:hypothetical protein n=1 Tax=Actinophytocola sp. TaxID=1872138 RepID=UPI003D6A6A9B
MSERQWRWELYGGLAVSVPADWDYGTTGWPPCLPGAEPPPRGYVGRPGPVPSIACSEPVPPLDQRSAYLWFDSPTVPGVRTHDAGWVEETRVVDGIALTVLSDDDAERAHVLDSVRPATADDGCPLEHAVTRAGARPEPGPGGLATLGPVESITLCRYALEPTGRPSPLLATSRLVGEQARTVVRSILAAPPGGGPDRPEDCLPEVALGYEVLLLLVRDGEHTQEVFVRYSGCDGHGIDDGRVLRRLTADSLAPLLSGPHQPGILNGAVAELIWP